MYAFEPAETSVDLAVAAYRRALAAAHEQFADIEQGVRAEYRDARYEDAKRALRDALARLSVDEMRAYHRAKHGR